MIDTCAAYQRMVIYASVTIQSSDCFGIVMCRSCILLVLFSISVIFFNAYIGMDIQSHIQARVVVTLAKEFNKILSRPNVMKKTKIYTKFILTVNTAFNYITYDTRHIGK